MGTSSPFDGRAAAALLTPLERTLAATLHETREIARKTGRECNALSDARAVIHALARFLTRNGAPVEMTDNYATSLACATLRGAVYYKFRELERLGIGPHEALHQAIEAVRDCFPVTAPATTEGGAA